MTVVRPAPTMCGRGHLLSTGDDVRVLLTGSRCARCADAAEAELAAVRAPRRCAFSACSELLGVRDADTPESYCPRHRTRASRGLWQHW